MVMKTRIPSNTKDEEKLPFSFRKDEISSQKIEEHWQKITDRLTRTGIKPDDEANDTEYGYDSSKPHKS